MIAKTLDRLRKRGAAAKRSLLDLAVAVVAGEKVADADLDKARIEAAVSPDQLAELIEVLAERRKLSDAYDADGLAKKREELAVEMRRVAGLLAESEAEQKRLNAKNRELREQANHCGARLNGHDRSAKQLATATRDGLSRTGDAEAWRQVDWPRREAAAAAVSLLDDPETRINIGQWPSPIYEPALVRGSGLGFPLAFRSGEGC